MAQRKRGTSIYGGRPPSRVPAYLISEAARYLRLPESAVRAWTIGQREFRPVIQIADSVSRLLSFENLVELHVLSAIRRQHRVRMSAVRGAVQFLEKRWQVAHPLARRQMLTDGTNLFVEQYGSLVNVSQHGQLAMKSILGAYLNRVEWDESGIPIRLFPFTSSRTESEGRIVLDPQLQFGRPLIRDTGIPTAIVAERFKAGETIRELARDYELPSQTIEEALRCELPEIAA